MKYLLLGKHLYNCVLNRNSNCLWKSDHATKRRWKVKKYKIQMYCILVTVNDYNFVENLTKLNYYNPK